MPGKKTMIAMSGGVDSSVAAYLMRNAGYDCCGATMLLKDTAMCEANDARSVANRLGIPFFVFDHTDDFRCMVIEPFIRCYEEGGTPNPCVSCNRHLKFDALLRRALDARCD